jgi:spermidine/putrescine transport system ATP-binding protein
MHYEITVAFGKNEMVIQSVNSAVVGEKVGILVAPDNIHIMVAEDHTNFFVADLNKNYCMEYNDKELDVDMTKIIKGSRRLEDDTLVDAHGEEIDPRKTKVIVSIQPSDIRLTDDVEEGLVEGYISNMIYKGDHYSYVIHTEDVEQDFVVNDEYLWNMDDHVGLIMPEECMKFKVKR